MPPTQQDQLDTRAIELSSATDAVVKMHLVECRDRYVETRRTMDQIVATAERNATALAQAIEANRKDFLLALEGNRKDREAGSARIYALLWKGILGLVGLLLTIIGYLVVAGGLLPGHH